MTSGLYVVDLRTDEVARIASCQAPCLAIDSVAWSPDGSTIAYGTAAGAGLNVPRSIRLVDPDGSEDRTLNVGSVSEPAAPSWSADGSRIYFSGVPYHGPQVPGLYSVAATGGEPEPLAIGTLPRAVHEAVAGISAPSVSPDEKTVVFRANAGGPFASLWIATIGGDDVRRIPHLAPEQATVSWLPDGSRIVVIADQRLQLVDPFTGASTGLTTTQDWVAPVVFPGAAS